MAEIKHGVGASGHGETTYSITGESNAGDSRPSSAKPSYTSNGSVIELFMKPGTGCCTHG